MKKDRKAATKRLIDLIDQLIPGSPNTKRYQDRLSAMSDKQFDDYMDKLNTGEIIPEFIVPNLGKWRLDIERNFKLAEQLGHSFFQKLNLTDPQTGLTFETPLS